MDSISHHTPTSFLALDLTGLDAEQQQSVEALVTHFRNQPKANSLAAAPYEEWARAFREWVNSHPPRQTLADDSRESIYAGRGE